MKLTSAFTLLAPASAAPDFHGCLSPTDVSSSS